MYNAKIITDKNAVVGFGWKYGSIFDIDPLNGVAVDVDTSQGFQQVGTTVESMGVKGLSRTIKGTFHAGRRAEAESMLNNLPIMTTGKLYFNDEYYCNIYVSKTPTIVRKGNHYSFSLMVYCNEPYWYKAESTSYDMGDWVKQFILPASYDSHIFATRNANVFVDCFNHGSVKTSPVITFTASSTVTGFGLLNAETLEFMKLNTEIRSGDIVRVYRKNSRLFVERTRAGKTDDIFEYLDETSSLFYLYPGSNVLKMTADENVAGLQCNVSFESAYVGVLDYVS